MKFHVVLAPTGRANPRWFVIVCRPTPTDDQMQRIITRVERANGRRPGKDAR